jgi:hypothetical protein
MYLLASSVHGPIVTDHSYHFICCYTGLNNATHKEYFSTTTKRTTVLSLVVLRDGRQAEPISWPNGPSLLVTQQRSLQLTISYC